MPTLHDICENILRATTATRETLDVALHKLAQAPITAQPGGGWIIQEDPPVYIDALYNCNGDEIDCLSSSVLCSHALAAMITDKLQGDVMPGTQHNTAVGTRSIRAIIDDLSRPLPASCIGKKPVKNKRTGQIVELDFIHWQHAVRLLDAHAPGWTGTVTHLAQIAGKVALIYRITIPCAEGEVAREATGYEDETDVDYGDPFSNAEAMAFKRAAAKFGVALYLYDKDTTGASLSQYLGGTQAASPEKPAVPLMTPQAAPVASAPHETVAATLAVATEIRTSVRQRDGQKFYYVMSDDLPKPLREKGLPVWPDQLTGWGIDPEDPKNINGWGIEWHEYTDKQGVVRQRVDNLLDPDDGDDIPF